MSQREAYLDAYPSSRKWKIATVDSRASELMVNGKVVGRYAELKAIVVDRMLDTVEVNLKNVLEELSLLAFSDPAKLYNSHGQLIPIQDLPEEVSRTIAEVTTSVRMIGKGEDAEPYEITKVKQHDKRGSLDMMMKHIGGYEKNNKIDVTHKGKINLGFADFYGDDSE